MTNSNDQYRIDCLIANQAEKISWLEKEIQFANDKIRDLYETISDRERELRKYRSSDPEIKNTLRSIFGPVYDRIDKQALAHEAATNSK